MWLPTNQLPAATGAGWCMTTANDGTGQFRYDLLWGLFYKYDTWNDGTGQKLASPNIPPVTASSMCYTSDEGYRANSLSTGTSVTSMTIPATNSQVLIGKEIEITTGTGLGEKRTITGVSGINILDSGIATSAALDRIADTTKRYEINQFIGYSVRLVFGNGMTQTRRILYNDSNTLYFYDINSQQLDPWNNTVMAITAPYVLPAVGTAYYIESCDVSWTTPIPAIDTSTSYFINTGGVWLISATAAAPWSSFQFYDNLTDTWATKTALGGQLLAALGTDFSLEIITKWTPFEVNSGTISWAARTLTDSTKAMAVDRYCNYSIHITGGTGIWQKNRIIANGATYFEIAKPWVTVPDATSTYEIHWDTDVMYLIGNGASVIHAYSRKYDMWYTGPLVDVWQARNISASFPGQEALWVVSITRATGWITSLGVTAGGTGWAKWNLFTITGTGGKGRVESVTSGWVVATVSLYAAGSGYTVVGGVTTTATAPAVGTGLTVNVLAVWTVGRVTLANNSNFYKNDPITFRGCTDAAWNVTANILAIDSLTTFDILATAAASAVASFSQSTTTLVDPTQNWATNIYKGMIVKIDTPGTAPTSQFREILSNTATVLTFATAVAATQNSRYTIVSPEAFGVARQYQVLTEWGEGRATGWSSTTLIDSTKNWAINQWTNYKVRVIAGTGLGSGNIPITGNNATTLTLTTPGFTPDSTTKYMIMEMFGTATAGTTTTLTDTSKNYIPGALLNKQIVLTSGTGQRFVYTITANTATIITFALATAPDATTTYSILAMTPRGVACNMRWINGNTDANTRWKYLLLVRGGATNVLDFFDISRNYLIPALLYNPKTALLTTWSTYTYNGEDIFYFTTSVANDFIYVYALNINTMEIVASYQTTAIQGTVHIWDLLCFVKQPDWLKFLFLALCTSRVVYKLQLIW